MPDELTLTRRIHFSMANKGRREIRTGTVPVGDTPYGRIPRLSRVMALAIKFEQMLASGAVRDQAELAELGHVSRTRVTQVMNLLRLAPDIQEEILFLPYIQYGDDRLTERHLRPVAALLKWPAQRRLWATLVERANPLSE
jgi:hypothetical protein